MNAKFMRSMRFRPDVGSAPKVLKNPYEIMERRVQGEPPVMASLMIGLRSGPGRGRARSITPAQVRGFLMRAFPTGGAIVQQMGWYEGTREPSLRVTIENVGTGMTNRRFIREVEQLAGAMTERFAQNEIWVDFYREGKRVRAVAAVWKAPK